MALLVPPCPCRDSRIHLPTGPPNLQAPMRCAHGPRSRGEKGKSHVLKLKQTTVDKARWLSIHFISPLCWPHWKREGKEKKEITHISHTHTHLTHSRAHLLCATDTYTATQRHTITYRELCRHTAPDTASEMQRHSMKHQSHNIYTHRYVCTLVSHSCTPSTTQSPIPLRTRNPTRTFKTLHKSPLQMTLQTCSAKQFTHTQLGTQDGKTSNIHIHPHV